MLDLFINYRVNWNIKIKERYENKSVKILVCKENENFLLK